MWIADNKYLEDKDFTESLRDKYMKGKNEIQDKRKCISGGMKSQWCYLLLEIYWEESNNSVLIDSGGYLGWRAIQNLAEE